MTLDNAWLDDQLASGERNPRFEEWNATSFAHLIQIMGGAPIDDESPSSSRPTPTQQLRAAKLLNAALSPARFSWKLLFDSRMRHARTWARAALKEYTAHPDRPFTAEEWEALAARLGSIN